jgi:hypothetical protein
MNTTNILELPKFIKNISKKVLTAADLNFRNACETENQINESCDDVRALFESGKTYTLKLSESKNARVCIYNSLDTERTRVVYMISDAEGFILKDKLLDELTQEMKSCLREMANIIGLTQKTEITGDNRQTA